MFAQRRRIAAFCMLLSCLPLLHGCAEIDANLKKAVAMKYAHVANVNMFQAQVGAGERQFVGVENGSFWAIFDICTLDVQGGSLSGFSYDANRFYVEAAGNRYGASNPGTVNVAGVPMSSQSAMVVDGASDAFKLSPITQFFPKQFYPNLRYRIAVFVRAHPNGYHGEIMNLQYDGQPQVAALVQNVGMPNPVQYPFYLPSSTPPIASTCP